MAASRSQEGRRVVPIVGYVICSGDRVVLVDTGFPARYVDDPIASGASEGLDAFGRVVALTPDNLPARAARVCRNRAG